MNLFLSFGVISIVAALLSMFMDRYKIIQVILLFASIYFGFTSYQTEICGMIGLFLCTIVISVPLSSVIVETRQKKLEKK